MDTIDNRNLLDAVDRLPERIALMLAPVLAEVLKTSASTIVDKVNNSTKTSKAMTKKEIETVSVASAANVVKSLENVFKQKRMIGAMNDSIIKLGMQQTGHYPRGFTQAQVSAQMSKSMPNWIKTGFKNSIPAVYGKAMTGNAPISGYMQNVMFQKEFAKFLASPISPVHSGKLLDINRAIGQAKLDKINKQIQMARYSNLTRFSGEGDFIKDKNALTLKGLKPKYWHNMSNMELLSKGAMPLSYGGTKSKLELDILGGILNNTKGLLVLDKKQQKEWDKWKKSFSKDMQGLLKSSLGIASTVISPMLKDIATIGFYKTLSNYVNGSKTPEERKNRSSQAKWGIAIGLPIVAAMASNPYIQGKILEMSIKGAGKLGKMGFTKLIGEEALRGGVGTSFKSLGSKIPLLAALATYGVGAWGAVTGFNRGRKEGGIGEGLIRGAVNIPTSIAKSILQMIPGLGKFASGISDVGIEKTLKDLVKIASLSPQLLKVYFDNTFKKIFGGNFDLFQTLKKAFIEAWKHRPTFLGGDGGSNNPLFNSGKTPKNSFGFLAEKQVKHKLNSEQLANAKTIYNVGKKLGMSDKEIQSALATSMQESSLINVRYGDKAGPDSRGLFQQRTPWGSEKDRMNPTYAATAYYHALKANEKKYSYLENEPITVMAQSVQRSAYPSAYEKHAEQAKELVDTFSKGTTTLPSAPPIPKQTTAPTRRISSNDPTQNNLCATVVLNSLTA